MLQQYQSRYYSITISFDVENRLRGICLTFSRARFGICVRSVLSVIRLRSVRLRGILSVGVSPRGGGGVGEGRVP